MKISTTFLIPVFDMIPVFDVSISEYTADIIYMDQSKKKKGKMVPYLKWSFYFRMTSLNDFLLKMHNTKSTRKLIQHT